MGLQLRRSLSVLMQCLTKNKKKSGTKVFLNLCSHVLGFAVISAVSVCLGVSDTVRCTVRARRSPFMMTSSDIQYCQPHFPSSSMEWKKLLSYLTVLEREIFEKTLVWSRIQRPAETAGALESCMNRRVRHRLGFVLIEWCYLTLNPHFNVPEKQQQSSGSVPVEHLRSGVSLFVDDGKIFFKKYEKSIWQRYYFWCHAWDVMWS